MKKQLLFAFVAFGACSWNTYAQENNAIQEVGNIGIGTTTPQSKLDVRGNVKIDSTLTVKDDVTIEKNLRVMETATFLGQTDMNKVGISGRFNANGDSRFYGTLRLPALTNTTNLTNTSFVITNAEGLASKVSPDTVANMLKAHIYTEPFDVDFLCTQVAPVAPTWANGPYKIFNRCKNVKVGIGTDEPSHGLQVTTNTRFFTTKVDENMGIGTEPNSFAGLLIKNETRPAGLQIKQMGNSHEYQKLLSLEYDEPTTEILKAYNPTTGITSHLFEANGKTIIHNGTKKIFQLENTGLLRVRRVKVDVDTWADFVFDDAYQLMPLTEVEAFVKENKHLPGIQSETELKENGMDVQEMNMQLMQKVEELTLYLIEQNKEIQTLKERLQEVEATK